MLVGGGALKKLDRIPTSQELAGKKDLSSTSQEKDEIRDLTVNMGQNPRVTL